MKFSVFATIIFAGVALAAPTLNGSPDAGALEAADHAVVEVRDPRGGGHGGGRGRKKGKKGKGKKKQEKKPPQPPTCPAGCKPFMIGDKYECCCHNDKDSEGCKKVKW